MYIPKAFEETRIPVLHELIRSQPFSSLITLNGAGLVASHLPLVLEDTPGSLGLLKGHLSRANPQWRDISHDVPALAIFAGPQHYITPSWYAEKSSTGKVVPTWNYVVVHAYGHLRLVEDTAWLLDHLKTLTNIHEAPFAEPWRITDAPADYIQSMSKGIVGIELAIERLEGKWKLNQNRNEADRRGVVAGLEQLGTETSEVMKSLVEDTM
jgi:transcriptional regulator